MNFVVSSPSSSERARSPPKPQSPSSFLMTTSGKPFGGVRSTSPILKARGSSYRNDEPVSFSELDLNRPFTEAERIVNQGPEYIKFHQTVEKHLAYIGHHDEGRRYQALIGLYSALDGNFRDPNCESFIRDSVVPGLLVLIEQPPPEVQHVLPNVDLARCHSLALKTFGSCGDLAVKSGVPRLIELLRRLARSRRLPAALAGTWGFLNPVWVVNAIVRTGSNGVRVLVDCCLDGFDEVDLWALQALAQHEVVQTELILPALVQELGASDGERRHKAVVALGTFKDRAVSVIDALVDLLLTGATDQLTVCQALRDIGEEGESALCDTALNSVRSRERKVAAAALGKPPMSNDDSYPVIDVRTGLDRQLLTEVVEEGEGGDILEVKVVVDSRELLTRLKTVCVIGGLDFPAPAFSVNNPYISSPIKNAATTSRNNRYKPPFRLTMGAMEALNTLLEDKVPDVRVAAVTSLANSQAEWALENGTVRKMFKLLRDKDGRVREMAILALGKLGPTVLELPMSSSMNSRKMTPLKGTRTASKSLINQSPWFKGRSTTGNSSSSRRSRLAPKGNRTGREEQDNGPVKIGSLLVQRMVKTLLNDSLHKARIAAAATLGDWGQKSIQAIPSLVQTLAEGKVLRKIVAKSIGKTGDEGIRTLTEIIEGVYLHKEVVYDAYDIDDKERGRLKQRLQRGGVAVRVAAIHGLEETSPGDKIFGRVVTTLYRSLKSPMPSVRAAGVRVLGTFYGRTKGDNIPYLMRLPDHLFGLLDDKDESVRRHTASVLATMNPKGEFFLVEAALNAKQASMREAAAWGLRKIGARCIQTLLVALNDKVFKVRRTVNKSICYIRPESIVSGIRQRDTAVQDSFRMMVLEILDDHEQDNDVRAHLLTVIQLLTHQPPEH